MHVANIQDRQGRPVIRWRCPACGRQHQYSPRDSGRRHVEGIVREIERAVDRRECWCRRPEGVPEAAALIEAVAAHIDGRARKLAPGTVRLLEVELGTLLEVAGEGATVADLSVDLYGRWWDHLVKVRKCSPATATARVRKGERFWRWAAADDRYRQATPMPRVIEDLPDPPQPAKPAPTWEEMDRAIAHAWGWYADLFLVLRFTGLRAGQAMRLQWADVDLDAGTLAVRPELGKSRWERRGRVVPMSPHLVAELAGWGRRDGFLIRTDTDLRTLGHHPMARAWKRAGVREQVWGGAGRGRPAHAFRAGFVTGLRSAGVDLALVQHLVGHDPGDVTTAHYTDQAQLWERMVDGINRVPTAVPVARVLPYQGRGWKVAR